MLSKLNLKGRPFLYRATYHFRLEAKNDDNALRIICAIINTADFCCTTADEVQVGIQQAIDDRFKDKVTLKSTIDMFDGCVHNNSLRCYLYLKSEGS